jgi:hypothetical protein
VTRYPTPAAGGMMGGMCGSCALVALWLSDVSVRVLQVGTEVELFWLPRQPEVWQSHRCYLKSFPVHPDRKLFVAQHHHMHGAIFALNCLLGGGDMFFL